MRRGRYAPANAQPTGGQVVAHIGGQREDEAAVLYCERDIPELGARLGDVVIVDGHGVRVLHPTAVRAETVVTLLASGALRPHDSASAQRPA